MDIQEFNDVFGRRTDAKARSTNRTGNGYYGREDRGLNCVHNPRKNFPDFHYIAEWCPLIEDYRRMVPHWLRPHGHFDGYGVPPKIMESCIEYANAGFRSPHVLIVEEKYGSNYFDASTTELMGQACLSILKTRREEGWYIIPEEPTKPEHTPGEFTKGSALFQCAAQEMETYNRRLSYYKFMTEFVKRVDHAIENCVYLSALRLLEERADHQYERVNLELMIVKNECRPQAREAQPQA